MILGNMNSVELVMENGWKEIELSEITEPIKDTYNPDGSNDFTYIGLEHIEQETLRLNSVGVSSDVTSNKFKFQPNDVLFGKLRPYFRKVVKPQFEGICSTDIWVFRSKKGFDQDFLFYFLANKEFVDTANSGESGSRMPRADWNHLKVTHWNVPSLKEQTAIATILSSLDDKIDLLHLQNKTLEQLAETLFRSYFPMTNEENKYVELGNYVECINGVSYKSSELNPSKVGMVSLKSFDRNGGFSIDGFKEFTGKYKEKQVVVEGDLIVAHTDITQDAEVIGNPALVISNPNFDTMIISMDIVKVISKVDWISIEFLYFLMRTRVFKSHCEGCANGSTVLHLNKQAIPTFEFPEPEKSKVADFTKQAKEIVNKIFLNHRQLRNLVKTRDTLLPKLMSGEVRVNL